MSMSNVDPEFREELNNISEKQPVRKDRVPQLGGGLQSSEDWLQRKRRPFVARQEEFMQDKKNLGMYHGDSYRLKQMFLNGVALMAATEEQKQPLNPLWMELEKCASPIKTPDEMRQKLEEYTHSDRVMVVRYFQDNCVACNAVEKTFEFICHESKRHFPSLDFYEVHREGSPELVKGMVRFPQVKGYTGGQWTDLDFKPPQEYRDSLYRSIGREIDAMRKEGAAITALQAEEMYFSSAGPAMYLILNESISGFYTKAQVRLHNYWKQVSVRRTWFYKTVIEPRVPKEESDLFRARSIMGERVELSASPRPDGYGEAAR